MAAAPAMNGIPSGAITPPLLFRPCATPSARSLPASVLRLVDEPALGDPRHHRAEAAADLLDPVLFPAPGEGVEDGAVGPVLEDPLPGERSVLDLAEDPLHLLLRLVGDDPRPARQVPVLGR